MATSVVGKITYPLYAVLGVAIFLAFLSFPLRPVGAASMTITNATTISTDSTIGAGEVWQVNPGGSITIQPGISLTNNGTLLNSGLIVGTIINYGNLSNSASMQPNDDCTSSVINYASFSNAGNYFNCGATNNNGILNNTGSVYTSAEFGDINNNGITYNSGTFEIYDDINNFGIFNNTGIIFGLGTFFNECGATLINSGSMVGVINVKCPENPPVVAISSATDGDGNNVFNFGFTFSDSITFGFDAVAVEGSIDHLDCFLVSNTVDATTPCSSPITYHSLTPGLHHFVVNATDTLGKQGTASVPFRVNVPIIISSDTTFSSNNGVDYDEKWIINPDVTLTVKSGAFFRNEGIIENNGTIVIEGTVNNFNLIDNQGAINIKCGGKLTSFGATLLGNSVNSDFCPYNLDLFEGSAPSDGDISVGENITAVATTTDTSVTQVTFTYTTSDPNVHPKHIVPVVSGKAEDTFEPDYGQWFVAADFGNGEVIEKSFYMSFFVVPESPFGMVALMGAAFAALGGFIFMKKRQASRSNGLPY